MALLTPDEELAMLNPDIKEVLVGKRKLRKVKIYPLSLADQTEFTELIGKAFVRFYTEREKTTAEFAVIIKEEIQTSLSRVFDIATDEGSALMSDVTNSQAADIAGILYDMNFGILEKKLQSLLGKAKNLFPSLQSSLNSSDGTPMPDQKTSLEKDSGTGE
jgi:hypothetical protein